MLGRDVRDHADLGLRDGREVGELADLARAQLADAELVLGLEPEERQRQAEAIVVVAMGGECRHVRGAERGEHVLRGRLAIRSGDADHLPAPRTPHLARDRAERRKRVVGLQHAHPRERARAAAAAQHGDRARRLHGVEEVVPVGALALERAEQRARPGGARIGDDALDAGRRIAAEQARSRQRACGERDQLRNSCATLRSSNGSTTPSMSWPCSCPLPRMRTRSPASASASARPMARRRSCSMCASPGRVESADDRRDDALGRLGARVVARHVEPVRPGLGRGAHERALGVVAVAARAEHAQQAPARERARRRQHGRDAAGRVRVVDDHAEVLARLDRLEAARRGARDRHRALDRAERHVQQQRQRDRAEHVVDVEAPAQARLEREAPCGVRTKSSVRSGAQLERLAAHVGGLGVDPEAELGIEPCAVGVVGVDRAREAPVEERRLGREVGLEVAVEVEVVLREVREADRRELRATSRRCAIAIEDASITQASSPASSMKRSARCRSGASGVVRPAAWRRPPMRRSTVPSSPHGRAAASRMAASSIVVVVLPFVPVTPTASSSPLGCS